MAEQDARLDSAEVQGRGVTYIRGMPRNDFLAGDPFDWMDMPRLIYPLFRTPEDCRNNGYRHFGDAVLCGTGAGVAFQPGFPGGDWTTYGFSSSWPGRFPEKEAAKRAVEAAMLSLQVKRVR